jgi:hypothetical protein
MSAVPGYDYQEDQGRITFHKDQAVVLLEVVILPKQLGELADQFQIVLDSGDRAVQFDPFDDGGEDANILTVTILNSRSDRWGAVPIFRILDFLFNMDFLMSVYDHWKDQIISAVFVGGDADAQKEATIGAWSIHFAVIPWKLFYGIFCPPPLWAWPCFLFSLIYIGLLTAFVYDLAELLGCVVGMDDRVTAITIVALGTSLPDLFASRTAALNDAYADASIVNVTGSNAVNVFLGIGLTWSLGAIYWHFKGTTVTWISWYDHLGHPQGSFVVEKGTLAFSVIVFLIAATLCLSILVIRRSAFGGELGGPRGAKYLTSVVLVGLWVGYVILSVWNANADRTSSQQSLAVLSAAAMTAGLMLFAGIVLNLARALTVQMHRRQSETHVPMEPRPSYYEDEKKKLLQMLQRIFPNFPWNEGCAAIPEEMEEHDAEHVSESMHLMETKDNTNFENISSFGPVLEELRHMRSELQHWTTKLDNLQRAVPNIRTHDELDEFAEGAEHEHVVQTKMPIEGAIEEEISEYASEEPRRKPSPSPSLQALEGGYHVV